MRRVTTIGLDIAKSVFQVHGVDANGLVVFRRKLKRRYVLAFFQKLLPCLIGIEACAGHAISSSVNRLRLSIRSAPSSRSSGSSRQSDATASKNCLRSS